MGILIGADLDSGGLCRQGGGQVAPDKGTERRVDARHKGLGLLVCLDRPCDVSVSIPTGAA